jgi:hypothetical protein
MIVSGLETVILALTQRRIGAALPARDEARPAPHLGLHFHKEPRFKPSGPPSSTRWAGGA